MEEIAFNSEYEYLSLALVTQCVYDRVVWQQRNGKDLER